MIDLFRGKITPKDWAVFGLVVVVVVALLIGAYLLIFTLQQNKINQIQAEVNNLKKKIAEAKKTVENYDKLQSQAAKMDNLVELFKGRLPDIRQVPQLMKQLESMGDSLGLKTQLTPLPSIIDLSKEVIPYQVVTKGSFHQILAFINLLEKDQRYLKISDLDIGPEKAGICEAKFVLSTFRFIEQEETETQPEKKS
ncbi:MAG TPA: type 4a pilus biogenesis protein PilO [Candidatus Hydrogenedens sp.]|nr:type 4a pilus biogenesis protein PilO [Candidatus Hydrogenedens sp.]